MNREKVKENYFFLLILCFILLLHLFSFILKLNEFSLQKGTQSRVFTIKVHKISIPVKKQIVQSEDSDQHELVPNAFLSDKTRSFSRQTRSRETGSFKKMKKKLFKKDIRLSDLGGPSEDPFLKAARNFSEARTNSPPVQDEHSKSRTSDYVEDVPLGDVTNLNTAEYKYYGFYHRIRLKLEHFWGRSLQQKAWQLSKQGRSLASSMDHITALQIILNSKGEIIGIRILGTSGVKELDDAAIDSFNEAGPFPNPPKGLIQDGKVTLEWGFVVTTS